MKRLLALFALVLALATSAHAAAPMPTALTASSISAANSPVTLTLSAGGAGTYHVVLSVQVAHSCTAAVVGTASADITTANLPGSLAWTIGNACAVGGLHRDVDFFPGPVGVLATAANTNTTVTCPALGATAVCRITVTYMLVVP